MQGRSHDVQLTSLIGPSIAERLRTCWPETHFCISPAIHELPVFLQDPMFHDLAALERRYAGPLEITRGDQQQYRVSGIGLRAAVEELKFAVHLSNLERYAPGAEEWLRSFETALGLPAQACDLHAFYNAEGVGLGAHCDPGEHLLFHVMGRKHFLVRPNPAGRYVSASHSLNLPPRVGVAVQYTDGLPDWAGMPEDSSRCVLEPGSVLFLPRGYYHATAGDESGVSGSVVVRFRTQSLAQTVTRYLHDLLMQSEAWREPIHSGKIDDACVSTRLRELANRISTLEIDTMRLHAERPPTAQPFRNAGRLLRNPAVRMTCEVDRAADTGRILGGRQPGMGGRFAVELSADAVEVIADIARDFRPVTFAALVRRLPDWDEDSLAHLVDFMLKHQILMFIPVEAF